MDEIVIARVDGDGKVIAQQRYRDYIQGPKSLAITAGLHGRKLFDILLDEFGYITYRDNKPAWNFILQTDTNRTIMNLLGKIAEAVLVRRCHEDNELNRILISKARYVSRRQPLSFTNKYFALGTGLLSTEKNNRIYYNPSETQRDIEWVDDRNKLLLKSGSTVSSGDIAGLQLKASTDGMNYVYDDLIKHRYMVPLVYFGVGRHNDFAEIASTLIKNGYLHHSMVDVDFIDAAAIDPYGFDEVLTYVDMVTAIVKGKLRPEQLLDIADDYPTLQTAITVTGIMQSGLNNEIEC
ncbi:hypothetical protein [Ruminococcus albus]|uniref:Uncharacterized protein n=1 Tax=Ruminococcus albus TaxID=1264 RepID=A0A1H7PIG6_RUMAL|nr:hypothetical protein [Ruminococcus albus]SEL35562.1 hypothetical protein SAMN05216469_1229 [Ruminococcus albus]